MRNILTLCAALLSLVAMSCICQRAHAAEADSIPGIPDHVVFSYASTPRTIGGTSADTYKGGAMLLTENLVSRFDNCRITEIEIANGEFPDIDEAPITIFFTNDLNEEPFFSFRDSMDVDRPEEYKVYHLPEPVEITAGRPFFAGFTAHAPEAAIAAAGHLNCPVWTDGIYHTDLPGGYIGESLSTGVPQDMEWKNDGYGCGQVCIRLRIEGDHLPHDIAELRNVYVETYLKPDSTYWVSIKTLNEGVNEMTDIDLAYIAFGDTVIEHIEMPYPVKYNQEYFSSFPITVHEEGVNVPITFEIVKVNGHTTSASSLTEKTLTIHTIKPERGFSQNMIVEEAGGAGCGWCVRGLVGLDRTFKSHNDGSFIPIMAHSPKESEERAAIGYEPFWSQYMTHTPTCLINRDIQRYGIDNPDYGTLGRRYDSITSTPAIAEIEISGYAMEDDMLSVESNVRFAMPEDEGSYSVAYVVTEDNVGPYVQNNEYSGYDGDMDGWENLPEKVVTYYDFLARGVSDFFGTPIDLPDTITPGESYSHTDRVSLVKVHDLDRLAVVAMVICDKTGRIENACRLELHGLNSLGGIAADAASGPEEYYDFSGRRLSGRPASGLCIRRQGGHAEKLLIR